MKEITNQKLAEIIYYLSSFFYLSTDFILGLVRLDINKFGQSRQYAKVIIFFLFFLLLFNIFFSSLTIYLLIPLIVSAILFLLSDKKEHFLNNKFSYLANEVWQDSLIFCKTWFKYGLLGAFVGVIIAIIQVEIFQGGDGGLFSQKVICIEYSADKASCLLAGTTSQIIGDRISLVILIYAGQAFIWTGLILSLIKDKVLLERLGFGGKESSNKWVQKIKDFRKTHYI